MAKKSKIARDAQRREIVARYAERRAELKELIRKPATPDDERLAAQAALRNLPRNASPVRLRNRDTADGRPRGYLRKFGLSRVRVREMAHRGELPGVHKSSW
ncbi:30S ribosomal protein S14 [Nocardia sp. NPDC051750]|jgi:small subunit ribosomal protein S14|uniref:30S ribosomal protein S14 n=1 Tax=Nocardia sp. NPDC051750 TaxID=3364325 RepID=UPI0037964D29